MSMDEIVDYLEEWLNKVDKESQSGYVNEQGSLVGTESTFSNVNLGGVDPDPYGYGEITGDPSVDYYPPTTTGDGNLETAEYTIDESPYQYDSVSLDYSTVDLHDPFGVMSGTYDPYGYGALDQYGSMMGTHDPYGYGSFDLGSYGPLGSTGALLADTNAMMGDTMRYINEMEAQTGAGVNMSSDTASLLGWMNNILGMSPEELDAYNRTFGGQMEGMAAETAVRTEVGISEAAISARRAESAAGFLTPYPPDAGLTLSDVNAPVSGATDLGNGLISYNGNVYRMWADGVYHRV